MTLTVEDLLARVERLELEKCQCLFCLSAEQARHDAIKMRANAAIIALGTSDVESFARELRNMTGAARVAAFGSLSATTVEPIARALIAASDWPTLQLLLDVVRGSVKDTVVVSISPNIQRFKISTPPGTFVRAQRATYCTRGEGLWVAESFPEYVSEVSYEKFDLKDYILDAQLGPRYVTELQLRLLKKFWNLQTLIDEGRVSVLELSREASIEITGQELQRRGERPRLEVPTGPEAAYASALRDPST